MIRRTTLVAFTVLAAFTSACGAPVDLKQSLQVTDVSSGWFDAGIQNGKNKLVPTVTFRSKRIPTSSSPRFR